MGIRTFIPSGPYTGPTYSERANYLYSYDDNFFYHYSFVKRKINDQNEKKQTSLSLYTLNGLEFYSFYIVNKNGNEALYGNNSYDGSYLFRDYSGKDNNFDETIYYESPELKNNLHSPLLTFHSNCFKADNEKQLSKDNIYYSFETEPSLGFCVQTFNFYIEEFKIISVEFYMSDTAEIENYINEYEYNNFTGKDAVSKKIIDSLEII